MSLKSSADCARTLDDSVNLVNKLCDALHGMWAAIDAQAAVTYDFAHIFIKLTHAPPWM